MVDNGVGVDGVMGTVVVAKSAPDAYTLVQCNVGTAAIALSLYAEVPYDQTRDIAPVTRIGLTPNIIGAHPAAPFQSMKDVVTYARARRGKLSYAAGMVGTSPPLTVELLKRLDKVKAGGLKRAVDGGPRAGSRTRTYRRSDQRARCGVTMISALLRNRQESMAEVVSVIFTRLFARRFVRGDVQSSGLRAKHRISERKPARCCANAALAIS